MKSVTLNWNLLGAELALLPSSTQARFFDGFARELMTYESHMARETQMIAIGRDMPKDSKEFLNKYLPTITQ